MFFPTRGILNTTHTNTTLLLEKFEELLGLGWIIRSTPTIWQGTLAKLHHAKAVACTARQANQRHHTWRGAGTRRFRRKKCRGTFCRGARLGKIGVAAVKAGFAWPRRRRGRDQILVFVIYTERQQGRDEIGACIAGGIGVDCGAAENKRGVLATSGPC